MTVKEVLEIAKNNNGLFVSGLDRFDDRFDACKCCDNSYNWDGAKYIFEIRQLDNLTYVFIPDSDESDIRGLSYDDNCVVFTSLDDFYEFAYDMTEESEEE